MADYGGTGGNESQTELSLNHYEKSCVDEFDKEGALLEEQLKSENEGNKDSMYTVFQGAASAVSNLYRGSSGSPSWPLFQTAANQTTILYKQSIDMIQRGFELGSRYGGYRRSKELLAVIKKKRRMVHRDEMIGILCNKPWTRSVAHGRHNNSARADISSPWFGREENETNMQLFKDASYPARRSSQTGNFSVSPARGVEDYSGCYMRDRKRLHQTDCRNGSPSHKRAKICFMETDEF